MGEIWGLKPLAWGGDGRKVMGGFTRSIIPSVCASCGKSVSEGEPHLWGCDVLVRLCAQLLATCDSDSGRVRWRDYALELSLSSSGIEEMNHWREVSCVPVPSVEECCEIDTPDLLRSLDGSGMIEVSSAVGVSRPFGHSLILSDSPSAKAIYAAMERVFGVRGIGWDVCPESFEPLQESPFTPKESEEEL